MNRNLQRKARQYKTAHPKLRPQSSPEQSTRRRQSSRLHLRSSASLLALLLFLWTAPALAQSCAMCYSTARAFSKDGQKAITRGVVVLVAPPLAVMTLGVGLAFRYSKKRDEAQPEIPPQE